MDRKGVTLIELLIVVAIIGILALIAVPAYIGQQKRAAMTEAYTNLQNLRLLEEQFFADNGCYYKNSSGNCADISNLQYKGTSASDGGLEDSFPGFKPGEIDALNYNYKVSVYDANGSTAGGFKAIATGKAGTRVEGDSFWIDSDNNKNF